MQGTDSFRDVADTAYWVAYFRARESQRTSPLFHDPYASALAGTRGRDLVAASPATSRYAEWTVLSRTVIIDRFIEQAVDEGVDAVLNLGAGLDARPYRLDLPEQLLWVEADCQAIIDYKAGILSEEHPRCQLRREVVDLVNAEARRHFLATATGDAKKVLVLTEGFIPYLDRQAVASLAQDLLALQNFSLWIAEYLHRRMYGVLSSANRKHEIRGAPFQFFPEEWYGFFSECGWAPRETRYLGEIAAEFKRKVPMPRMIELIYWLLPARVKEESLRSSGFVLFERCVPADLNAPDISAPIETAAAPSFSGRRSPGGAAVSGQSK